MSAASLAARVVRWPVLGWNGGRFQIGILTRLRSKQWLSSDRKGQTPSFGIYKAYDYLCATPDLPTCLNFAALRPPNLP
jgi:hypothetical protein